MQYDEVDTRLYIKGKLVCVIIGLLTFYRPQT